MIQNESNDALSTVFHFSPTFSRSMRLFEVSKETKFRGRLTRCEQERCFKFRSSKQRFKRFKRFERFERAF